MIRTISNDIASVALMHTQCHEHLYIKKGISFNINHALCMENEEKTTSELLSYRNAGGSAVVDSQPPYCGRMAEMLIRLSQRTGVHIIAVTGFHKLCFYENDSLILTADEKKLYEFFRHEIETGMVCTDGNICSAKAGLVKVAFNQSHFLTSKQSKVLFVAAARASASTGAPVLVHTEKDADVFELIDFFKAEGISPQRLIICHLDRMRYDIGYHLEVASTGAYLCYDSINRLKYLSHEQELTLIRAMIDAGYKENLLLSLDVTNKRMRYYGGSMGLDYILTEFIPMLRAYGIDDETILDMTQNNARRALSFEIEKGGTI